MPPSPRKFWKSRLKYVQFEAFWKAHVKKSSTLKFILEISFVPLICIHRSTILIFIEQTVCLIFFHRMYFFLRLSIFISVRILIFVTNSRLCLLSLLCVCYPFKTFMLLIFKFDVDVWSLCGSGPHFLKLIHHFCQGSTDCGQKKQRPGLVSSKHQTTWRFSLFMSLDIYCKKTSGSQQKSVILFFLHRLHPAATVSTAFNSVAIYFIIFTLLALYLLFLLVAENVTLDRKNGKWSYNCC